MMTHIVDEQLSAFLDGELPAEELELMLARLDRDPELRARLGRYAMIGECVRNGEGRPQALVVAERVREAIAAGPDSGAHRPPRSRALAFAAAAALAVAAFFMAAPGPGLRGTADVAVAVAPSARESVRASVAPVDPPVRARVYPRQAEHLTTYMVAHSSFASPLAQSSLHSHLVTARIERASWRQSPEAADAP